MQNTSKEIEQQIQERAIRMGVRQSHTPPNADTWAVLCGLDSCHWPREAADKPTAIFEFSWMITNTIKGAVSKIKKEKITEPLTVAVGDAKQPVVIDLNFDLNQATITKPDAAHLNPVYYIPGEEFFYILEHAYSSRRECYEKFEEAAEKAGWFSKGTREDGWIEWHGGKRPTDVAALVVVRYADGSESEPRPASKFYWGGNSGAKRIVAYRLAGSKPQPKSQRSDEELIRAALERAIAENNKALFKLELSKWNITMEWDGSRRLPYGHLYLTDKHKPILYHLKGNDFGPMQVFGWHDSLAVAADRAGWPNTDASDA